MFFLCLSKGLGTQQAKQIPDFMKHALASQIFKPRIHQWSMSS